MEKIILTEAKDKSLMSQLLGVYTGVNPFFHFFVEEYMHVMLCVCACNR